jgi:hypothetical protein
MKQELRAPEGIYKLTRNDIVHKRKITQEKFKKEFLGYVKGHFRELSDEAFEEYPADPEAAWT